MLEVRVKRKLPGFTLDVAFSVNQEILTILGPSGSGKTMTLQCIAGLIQPDEGYIRLNDKVLLDSTVKINLPAQMRKVGFVFQDYALFPHLSVRQNIAYGMRHLEADEIKDRVSGLLDKMNLQKLGDRYPKQLSAGQQQRVAVARALAPEPDILLLDEPFSALDSPVKERLQLEFQSLQSFYKGNMLFVTHDLAEGYRIGSRIAVFDSGKVVQCDVKNKVTESPASLMVARLTGFRNLLEGNITRVEDGHVWVRVQGSAQDLKVVTMKSIQFSLHENLTIGIRPEYIKLSAQQGENTIPAVVDRVIEGVATLNCYLTSTANNGGRRDFEVCLPRSMGVSIATGQLFHLYLPPEHIALMTN